MSYLYVRSEPLRIFIGYDQREAIAYHVLSHSILTRSSVPVMIAPLVQSALREQGIYNRERTPLESTEFSMTRFLVPYLCGYRGNAVFMDCDMLCRVDIAELWDEILESEEAVLCCQHSYTPSANTKFLGNPQTAYPRKNWSSFMVFDCTRCRALTPDYVNTATGLELHRMLWMDNKPIGALPLEWNWLVGEYEKNYNANILHYTLGGPWFAETAHCDHADEWRQEASALRLVV